MSDEKDSAILPEQPRAAERERDAARAERDRLAAQLHAVTAVGQVAGASPDLDTVLGAIIDHAQQLLGATGAVVYELDKSTGVLHPRGPATASLPVLRALAERPLHVGEGVGGRAVATLAPVQLPNLDGDVPYPAPLRAALRAGGTRSLLGVPLVRDGRALGAIVVGRGEAGAFSPEDVALLETFAAHSAVALDVARLVGDLHTRTAEQARLLQELRSLAEVSRAVSATLDLDTVLPAILTHAGALAGTDGGAVFTFDEASGAFTLAAASGIDDPAALADLGGMRVRFGTGLIGEAAARREPVQFADWQEQPDAERLAATFQVLDIRAVLALPLLIEGQVVGVLTLGRRQSGAFDPETVDLLTAFAAQSAVAIHNARLYQALETRGHELEEVSRHKTAFMATMSHELRTPLNAIIGYGEILEEEAQDQGYDGMLPDLNRILTSARHLLGLINDLLDFARIDAGTVELYLEEIDTAALAEDVARLARPLMAAGHNDFTAAIAADLGPIRTDATKVRQILLHLLSNAAKFTNEGRVTLRVWREARSGEPASEAASPIEFGGALGEEHPPVSPLLQRGDQEAGDGQGPARSPLQRRGDAPGGGRGVSPGEHDAGAVPRIPDPASVILFRVEDTGIGMSEEQIGRLFAPFTQIDASTTRRYGGTGLGLAIAHEYCRLLGGTITVESAPGQGSTFTVRLPERTGSGPETRAPLSPGIAVTGGDGPLVLVIDDDPVARDVLQRMLGKEGFRVALAAGGEEGLRLAKALRPVAITLDVLMPGMDGWQVLAALRADPGLAALPVIMLTMLDNREIGYALGASAFMTKPVDRSALVALLRRYQRAWQPSPVLVVEDDADQRGFICRVLEQVGWETLAAENGRVALDHLERVTPAVILLDLLMPEMDGFEVVAALRVRDDWRSIPVVILTAKDLSADDRMRLNGGVERVLHKGAWAADLVGQIRALVADCMTRGRAGSGASG